MYKAAIIATIMFTSSVEASRLSQRQTQRAQVYSKEYENQKAEEAKYATDASGSGPQAYSYNGSYYNSYDGSTYYYGGSSEPATVSNNWGGNYNPKTGASSNWGSKTTYVNDGNGHSHSSGSYYSSDYYPTQAKNDTTAGTTVSYTKY